ncbi:unnamed protein product [Didymodactylos carnosus]|uniref:Reverse transcriptase RNase H-like domain-containing protein n=1 Tax=Didymodactylos carnosus TaxID=1234261 RepID=A0A8S2KHI0_9BILA|nr:unnamed protein product [Didymodactylos carnosus]CAF3850037.1 unnamed protein product [Didymodactylos carnosus]
MVTYTPKRQQAFELLKERLISAPIVTYPNFDYPFMLQLDASDYGLGAVLAQNIERKEHVIAFASRTLQPCERKYSAPERECLVIVWGTQHFRPYLEGRPFEVWTDHRSLQWLRSIKDPTSRLARWAMKLDAYDMVIKHRPEENQEVAVNLWDHCNILDDIKSAQRQDINYSPLISFIQDDIQPDDEVLHRKLENFAKTHRVISDAEAGQLALAIRAAINESTGQTPAFLMYGRELKLPLDLMYGPEVDVLDELRSSDEVRANKERLKGILESAHELAKENLEIARENQKSSYDLHRKNVQFAVGEKVLMTNTAGSRWLVSRKKSIL